MREFKVAIIGGSGLYRQSFIENYKEFTTDTRYGKVSLKTGTYQDKTVYFLPRHGDSHNVPPHLVNYRANIAALKTLDVDAIIATAAVGTMRREMVPGTRVIVDQCIDFTRQRPLTFYEGQEGFVVHTDFSEPYCNEVRSSILKAGRSLDQAMIDGGCYICTEGPRFETPAEIKMFKDWGADVVGMTSIPEAILAREAGLCYATIALPTNYAAGLNNGLLTQEEVLAAMEKDRPQLEELLKASITEIKPGSSCSCKEAGKYYPRENQ